MKNKCTAAQMSDQMVCSQCNQAWDVNAICTPECKPLLASDMTMRDHFAGLAMQGALANPEVKETAGARSEWAYEIADAMIRECSK